MRAVRRVYASLKAPVKRKGVLSTGCATYEAMADLPQARRWAAGFAKCLTINNIEKFLLNGEGASAGGRNALRAHIRPQHFWNHDGAVGLLIVFNHRDPGAADRQAAAV
jgi:hypothetical protein